MKERIKEKRMQEQQKLEQERRRKKRIWIMMSIGIFLIVASVVFAEVMKKTAPNGVSFDYAHHPSIGSKNSPVKVVEFGDFKCPVCKDFSEQVYPLIDSQYIAAGKVQFYFFNYPFIGPDSTVAALAAESVYHQNPQAFWPYYHAIYNHQKDEKTIWATPDYLVQLAKDAKINVDYGKLKQDIIGKTYIKEVNADNKKGNDLNIGGTPTLFVNGKLVQGFSYPAVKNAIDQALKEGKK